MKISKTLKTLLIILAVVAVAMVIIFVMGKPKSDATNAESLVTTTASGQVVDAGSLSAESATNERVDQLVVLLRSVTSIELDDAVFTSPVYHALTDISQRIDRDPNPGRLNPFMPIGFESPTNANSGGPTEASDDGLTVVDLGDSGDLDLFMEGADEGEEGGGPIETETIQ